MLPLNQNRHLHPPRQQYRSSPPGSSSSTVPIAELVREAPRVDRFLYFTPPIGGMGTAPKAQHQIPIPTADAGLRRFFFGDSPQLRRHPFNNQCSTTSQPNNRSLPMGGAARLLSAGGLFPYKNSHSSRTVSVDFGSETSVDLNSSSSAGINKDADDGMMRMKRMIEGGGGGGGGNNSSSISREPSVNINSSRTRPICNGNTPKVGSNGQFQKHNDRMESPLIAMRQHPHNTHHYQQPQTQPAPPHSQFNGAQFDTRSLQSRRSRSICTRNNTLPPNGTSPLWRQQQPQHSSPVHCGSCSNLSVLMNGSVVGGGPLVLYEGGEGHCSPIVDAHRRRHSMALAEAQQQMAPSIWYQPMVPPPPPPFYYSAATLPLPPALPPPPAMDLATFRRVLKETERMEKKQQQMQGDRFTSVCWEFCCGGSALILWLILTLIILGFLAFLLLTIYFF